MGFSGQVGIRTRLWLGFLLILLPVLVLGLMSGLSFKRLSQSSSAVSESLLRHKETIGEYTRLTHLNDLANTLLRNFLKLGYVTEMAEVHPLQARVREDLDELSESLDLDLIPAELKTVSQRLRQSFDVLVAEKSKEITMLESLQEVQSTKIPGVNDGLEKLEERFSAQMKVRPQRVRRARKQIEARLARGIANDTQTKNLFRGLTLHEIERLWELSPLSVKKRSLEVDTVFRLSTVAYAERVERLMVAAKNLNVMRSMRNQGTRLVTELQENITQSRNRSFTTITAQLIPDTKKVEEAIAPRIRALEATVSQRLEEAQALSGHLAQEISGTFRNILILVGLCLLIGFIVMVLAMRAINQPVQALVEASKSVGSLEPKLSVDIDDGNEALKKKVVEKLRARGSSLVVMVVEDEAVYSDAIAAQIQSDKDFRDDIHILFAKNGTEALQMSESHPLDLILCDLDLGKESMNGFELVRQFRASASRAHICIHSDRSLRSDYRTASDAGADAFLPKPLSRAHLLQLILAALERAEVERQNLSAARSAPRRPRTIIKPEEEGADFVVDDLTNIKRDGRDEPLPS